MTSHTPQKCAICGEYHCLAGCVPVEQCKAKATPTADIVETLAEAKRIIDKRF